MSARSQVTITLGQSGQVVKRARSTSDGRHSDDGLPAFGGKRPVRERLESNITNSNSYGSHYHDKRQRTVHNERFVGKNLRGKQIESGVPSNVGKDDLRWKLIKKSLSRRGHLVTERRDVDLRERLSRSIHNSSRSNARQQPKESSASSLGRRIPSARSADDLFEMDSHRKSYSVALDKPRHNSPDRLISVPRHMPHSRRYGDLQDAPGIISLDASRPSYLTNTLVGEASRSVTYMSKATLVDVARPAVRASAPGVSVHRSELGPGEPLTVSGLLTSLGLGKYAILFQAEEVDMAALRQMRDNDLKEMGIPMFDRYYCSCPGKKTYSNYFHRLGSSQENLTRSFVSNKTTTTTTTAALMQGHQRPSIMLFVMTIERITLWNSELCLLFKFSKISSSRMRLFIHLLWEF